jgi:putative transposase
MPRGMTHTAQQIARALRLVDEGARVGDVCRQMGIVEKTFYRWRERYAVFGESC